MNIFFQYFFPEIFFSRLGKNSQCCHTTSKSVVRPQSNLVKIHALLILIISDYPVCRADGAEGRCSLNPPHGVGIYPKVDSIRVGDSLIVYCKEGPVQKGLVDCTSTGSITEEGLCMIARSY